MTKLTQAGRLTPAEIEAIRKRVEKATAGEWRYYPSRLYSHDMISVGGFDGKNIAEIKSNESDGSFIAHAREDIPKLLAEIERMRAGIMYAMQETYCDDTRDFLRRLLIGEEKTELPYRMGHRYGGDSE